MPSPHLPAFAAHHDETDLLDLAQRELETQAEELGFTREVDRRQFVFLGLAAAAAGTFGVGARAIAQPPAGGASGGAFDGALGGAAGSATQPPAAPPLDNMETVAWTFQPYPGGTGALLERTYRERGPAAFARQPFAWRGAGASAAPRDAFLLAPWGNAPFPTDDETIAFLPVHRLAAAIRARKLTSTRLTRIYLDRLKRHNDTLLCAVTILEAQALAEAARADAELAAGRWRGPLHGIPYGVKDLFAVRGTPTTWGARDFDGRVIDVDSEVVVRLREAGAVLLAKLSTGQFAQGGNWYRGGTRNPWNLAQSSSGSSAGPASATAAGCVAFGIGTETSGSIVSPATACGISALRPTFGRVSRHGGMVLAWSQDRVGPMTRTIEDAAIVFNVIHGADEKDPGSITMPFRFARDPDLSRVRIGLRASGREGAAPDPYLAAFVQRLRDLGARPTPLGDPPTVAGAGGMGVEYAAAFDAYVRRKAQELGLDLAQVVERYGRPGAGGGPGGAPAGADPFTPRSTGADPQFVRWVPGRLPTAMDFVNAQRRRHLLITAWQRYLQDVDCYVGAADTGAHALTGHPAVVLPIGFGVRAAGGGRRPGAGDSTRAATASPAAPAPALNPQPICAQIAGNLYRDDLLLAVADTYQRNTDWLRERPRLA